MLQESMFSILVMIGLVHLVALISPGPDFVIILRSCMQFGKRYALWTALGIGLGVAFHLSYCMFGLNMLTNAMPQIMRVVAFLGSIYFLYQGYSSITSAFYNKNQMKNEVGAGLHIGKDIERKSSLWLAITSGFFTNALNPKAVVYFLSFFAAMIAQVKTPVISVMASVEVFMLTWIWFSILALLVSSKNFLGMLNRYNFQINLIIGVIFILFSFSMMFFTYQKFN